VSAIEPEQSWRGPVATILVGIATAIVIVSVAIAPFLSSPWLAFEQGRAEATAWTGFSEAELARVTNAIVEDLVAGPADFDVAVDGAPVLNERERGHMRDVRTVFMGLWVLTGAALIVLGQGPTGRNAKVNLGPLQPVEFIRLLLALFLAGYFAKRWELLRQVRGRRVRAFDVPAWLNVPRAEYLLPVLGGVAIALLFFFLQKDLGPALFLSCVFLLTYALARNRAGLAIAGFGLLIAGFYIGYALNISSTLTARVAMWRSLWDNGARGGEQIAQAIWGLATGGVFGTGLGLGNTGYVPAGYTDLMLAAIGEELGFAGLLAVAGLFVIITARGFDIARRAPDDYSFFLASVITLFLTLPVLVMGAGMLGLVPLTGVVTPFLSFGGSAMVANFVALGILTAIRRQSTIVRHVRSDVGHVGLDVPITEPFRKGVGRIVIGFSAAAVIILIALFDVQVVRANAFVARPHVGVLRRRHPVRRHRQFESRRQERTSLRSRHQSDLLRVR